MHPLCVKNTILLRYIHGSLSSTFSELLQNGHIPNSSWQRIHRRLSLLQDLPAHRAGVLASILLFLWICILSHLMFVQLDKYKNVDFGRCPRVNCSGQPCLPVGQSDVPRSSMVKIYCPRCEDIYTPRSKYLSSILSFLFKFAVLLMVAVLSSIAWEQ